MIEKTQASSPSTSYSYSARAQSSAQQGASKEFSEIISSMTSRVTKSSIGTTEAENFYYEQLSVIDPQAEQIARKTSEMIKENISDERNNKQQARRESQSEEAGEVVERESKKAKKDSSNQSTQQQAQQAATRQEGRAARERQGREINTLRQNQLGQQGNQVVEQFVENIIAKPGAINALSSGVQIKTDATSLVSDQASLIDLTKSLLADSIGKVQIQKLGVDAVKVDNTSIKSIDKAQEASKEAKHKSAQLTKHEASQTLNKVEQALQEAIKSSDGKTVSVRLDPPSLGSIKVDITLKEGSLFARVTADTPQVGQLLREKGHEMQEMLRRLGLDVDQVLVFVGSESHGDHPTHQQHNQKREFSWVDPDLEEQAAAAAALQNVNITSPDLSGWIA